ncbi:MAG: DUF4339 domain-containing protein [Pirellulales bacterium]
MSADWYYMKTGFFGSHKAVGPICETEMLDRIGKGEVAPATMISSTSKTHGHWLAMREIRPAYKHWQKTHPNAAEPSKN